ncbi:hypothetical protein LR48_Vigan09g047500 [Vigna angularis]|uniref:Putative plant transposon protein domain-containing protein n=1 Tax=Phaseolus angularis TaxID=3914 RepID=A0A0L9V9Q8_PHAAN|nr:hypothetical protein LR48_Vigan09g047500 [Vigna angularis]
MTSSSGKRLKTMATKRKEKEPEQPHSSRFLSRKHEKHFKVVQDRRLLMERKVGMIPNFAPQFGEALFIYCAIRNLNVNIGQVIADEISVCANTSNNKAPLGHPSLITHLCKLAGVDTFLHHLKGQEKPLMRPITDSNVEMRDMYMSLIGTQLQSIHRGQMATAEMIVGMYDTPPAHRWTMEEFHNVVAWPEEPVQGGGAEASVRVMEEDEADDDDAFEDDEDEEEEEDTEDSSD